MKAGIRLGFAACALAASLIAGCTHTATPATRDVRVTPSGASSGAHGGPKINQFEMQEDVQRFTSKFISSVTSATEPLTEREEDMALRRAALSRLLVYSSSALDIASGPLPEVNALDMVVFVSLSRSSLERYWMPEIFGERAAPLLAAFQTSERQAWDVAAKILTTEQQSDLSSLIRNWLEENPENIRVELVRFQEFSEVTGEVKAEQRQRARGLLGSVTAATQAADHALLLSERAMFLANRMPFLLRVQTRLGAQEMIGDSMERVGADVLHRIPDPRSLMSDLLALTLESRRTLEELRLMADSVRPLLESGKLQDTLDGTTRLTADARDLLRELRAIEPERAEDALLVLEARANRFTRRLLLQLGLLGAGWILLFWSGYYAVKRLRPSDRPNSGRHPRFPRPRPSHP